MEPFAMAALQTPQVWYISLPGASWQHSSWRADSANGARRVRSGTIARRLAARLEQNAITPSIKLHADFQFFFRPCPVSLVNDVRGTQPSKNYQRREFVSLHFVLFRIVFSYGGVGEKDDKESAKSHHPAGTELDTLLLLLRTA